MSESTGLSALRLRGSRQPQSSIPPPPRRWLTRLALPVAILLAALILLGYAARSSLRPAVDVRVVQVVSRASTGNVGSVTVQAPGWLEADPFPIYVPALASGVVKEVLVLEGQAVAANQVVARLIDDDARLALDQARARLEDARARLAGAQADWDDPIELDRLVAVGQANHQQVEAEREQISSEIAVQAAKLEELEDRHQRLAALPPESVAQQQVIEAGLQRDAQQAVLDAARNKLEVVEARLTTAAANLEAARENRRLRIRQRETLDRAHAELQRAEVAVAEAELRLERMAVRAPAAGIVMSRLAVPGSKLMLEGDNKFSANAVHLYDPDQLQVRVDVPLADAAKVGIDQPAEVTVDVLPDRRFQGKVTRIVHEADIQKNTLEVKVAIHDPTPQLKPEMLARVKFMGSDTGAESNGLAQHVFVPERLLQDRTGDTAKVWLVTAGNEATRREVQLGTGRQDGWVETVSGLQPGDKVIAEPIAEIDEGQRVRITGEVQP
jgi:HlyD family secretion protein